MSVDVSGASRPGRAPIPHAGAATELVATVTVTLNVIVVLAMVQVLLDPGWAHLDGKAPIARAVLFPAVLLALPLGWLAIHRTSSRPPYPWVADLLVTLTCFVDIAGNRLGLYDTVTWFDNLIHLTSSGLISAAYVLLVVPRPMPGRELVEAGVAAGLSASLAWELFEYTTFLARTTEWTSAYPDTIDDLTLGWVGSLAAVVVLAAVGRRRGWVTGGRHAGTDIGPNVDRRR